MIRLTCSCGKAYGVRDEHAGKRTKCPACGGALLVPSADAPKPAKAASGEQQTLPPWWYSEGDPKPPRAQGAPRGRPESTRVVAPPSDAGGAAPAAPPAAPPRRRRALVVLGGIAAMAALLPIACWSAGVFSPDSAEDAGASGTGIVAASPPGPADPSPDPPGATPSGTAPGGTALASDSSAFPEVQFLIPAYFYPAGPGLREWERLFEAAARVPIVAVANPASGVGEQPNPDYSNVIARAGQRGLAVVGYVFTEWGNRPAAEVKAEVDRWVEFYPAIRGIFFDAQASDAAYVEYYADVSSHAREAIEGALVVTNPGTACDEGYASRRVADVILIFENTSGFERFQLPRWADRSSGVRFAALPHEVETQDRMRDYIELAGRRGISLIFVSGAAYDHLPEYWEQQVDSVQRLNRGEVP